MQQFADGMEYLAAFRANLPVITSALGAGELAEKLMISTCRNNAQTKMQDLSSRGWEGGS